VGDGIYDIIDKVNGANIATKVSLNPVSKALVFETTIPHQIWFDENNQESRVLRDLGVLSELDASTPFNYHQNLKIQGGSTFDVIISLRDSLLSGNQASLGSSDLQGVSLALDNLLNNMTDLGSRDSRLERTIERLDNQIPMTLSLYTSAVGLDVATAILEFNMLNMTRDTTLGAQARLSQSNLLNFLR
jgi:flagellar hook-associated protein 3 FlgL